MSAPDPVPALVAERNKIWHSNDGDGSNPAISDDERERRVKSVCDQVNVLDNRIADIVAPSVDGILAQFELLMELTDEGTDRWSDNRDRRLMEAIKAGLRNQTGEGKGAGPPRRGVSLRPTKRDTRNVSLFRSKGAATGGRRWPALGNRSQDKSAGLFSGYTRRSTLEVERRPIVRFSVLAQCQP